VSAVADLSFATVRGADEQQQKQQQQQQEEEGLPSVVRRSRFFSTASMVASFTNFSFMTARDEDVAQPELEEDEVTAGAALAGSLTPSEALPPPPPAAVAAVAPDRSGCFGEQESVLSIRIWEDGINVRPIQPVQAVPPSPRSPQSTHSSREDSEVLSPAWPSSTSIADISATADGCPSFTGLGSEDSAAVAAADGAQAEGAVLIGGGVQALVNRGARRRFHRARGPFCLRFTYVTPVFVTKLRMETPGQAGSRPQPPDPRSAVGGVRSASGRRRSRRRGSAELRFRLAPQTPSTDHPPSGLRLRVWM
jgi:hypothetical protein